MLILTRKIGESIVIGDNVVVRVVDAGKDQVRLGIDAPRSVAVHREEVYAQISRENEAARSADAAGMKSRGRAMKPGDLPTRPKR